MIDEASPLCGITAEELETANVSLANVVTGYDVIAAHRSCPSELRSSAIRFGYRYADILDASDAAGPIGIDHGRFHDTYKT